MKVAVGLSGGVDSAAAALILKRQGYEVIGVTMKLFREDSENPSADVKSVAGQLDIPFAEIDLSGEYYGTIINYMLEDYRAGRTPNPCVQCNREIKFGLFWEKTRELFPDVEYFATGHYAIIETHPSTGRRILRSGVYAEKDQAYFLSLLTQEQLARTLFPLGEMTKPQVRELCRQAGLSVHKKQESQDLCFGEYRKFVSEGRGPGNFLDAGGKILGRHKGIEHYTIGQRRGLGIGGGEPLYVLAIRPDDNEIVLGFDDDLRSAGLIIREITWGMIENPRLPYSGRIKIRYRDEGSPAVLEQQLEEGRYRILFDSPRRAVTPGQLAVFYDGDYVAFAGFIDKAL